MTLETQKLLAPVSKNTILIVDFGKSIIHKDFGKSKLKKKNYSLPDLGIKLSFCQVKMKILKKCGTTLIREEENVRIKHPLKSKGKKM